MKKLILLPAVIALLALVFFLGIRIEPETGALNANSLNNYQPAPYTKGGAAWERTMSIRRGEYAGSNFVPTYWDILSAMNG